MPKAKPAAVGDDASAAVRARVLVACSHGPVDAVVALPPDVAAAALAAGEVDTDPAAVAYAEQLAAARPGEAP